MAQKSAKQLAARNAKRLNQTHTTTAAVHALSLLLRLLRLTFAPRLAPRSIALHLALSAPALGIEAWLERSARPRGRAEGGAGGVVRAGEDLEAGGVMEWCWDVIYWSWGCVGLAGIVGDKAWYAWVVIPLYTVWSLYSAYTGVKSGLGGMMGQTSDKEGAVAAGQSKRQAKMEKRGGQKMQYR